MHLIIPKNRPLLSGTKLESLPLFFLAGPIRGGGDWHRLLSDWLTMRVGDCIIANPSRYDSSHPHYQHKLDGPILDERQTDWERYYLRQAASDWLAGGCIIFWLAEQVEPRDDGSPYARDTYGELGEWRGRMSFDRTLRVVVGAEPGFHGLSVIARNFEQALGHEFEIHQTMEDVVNAAANHVRES